MHMFITSNQKIYYITDITHKRFGVEMIPFK